MPLTSWTVTDSPARVAWSRAARYRSGVISVGEALRAILDATPVLRSERSVLTPAAGGVAAEAVVSPRGVPPAPTPAMDGFAVRGADVGTAPVRLRLVGS